MNMEELDYFEEISEDFYKYILNSVGRIFPWHTFTQMPMIINPDKISINWIIDGKIPVSITWDKDDFAAGFDGIDPDFLIDELYTILVDSYDVNPNNPKEG